MVSIVSPRAIAATDANAVLQLGDFREIAARADAPVRLSVRDVDAAPMVLELAPIEVFAADARIVLVIAGKEIALPRPQVRYFRISGPGEDRGLMVVTEEGDVAGLVQRGGTYLRLDTSEGFVRLAERVAEADSGGPFTCGNDAMNAASPVSQASEVVMSVAPDLLIATHQARIAIDTDEEFLARFSGNSTTATNYVGALIGYISTIYDAQVQTQMQVSYLRLWTPGTDPWVQTTSGCMLLETGKHWNDNQGAVSRTIMHFLSGKTARAGIAWIGVLCGSAFSTSPSQLGQSCAGMPDATSLNYGGAYGVTSGIAGNFDATNPISTWDLVGVAHEIGHNFNSPHTHCYAGLEGNASSIDQCYVEGGAACYAGPTSLPGAGLATGTLMSYCHMRPGGMANIALTLGAGHGFGVAPERVPTRMRNHVLSRAQAMPACLALPAPDIYLNGFE